MYYKAEKIETKPYVIFVSVAETIEKVEALGYQFDSSKFFTEEELEQIPYDCGICLKDVDENGMLVDRVQTEIDQAVLEYEVIKRDITVSQLIKLQKKIDAFTELNEDTTDLISEKNQLIQDYNTP